MKRAPAGMGGRCHEDTSSTVYYKRKVEGACRKREDCSAAPYSGEGFEEGLHFVFDHVPVFQGLSDFFAEEFAVAFAEAVGVDAQVVFTESVAGGGFGVFGVVPVDGEEDLQEVEEGFLVFGLPFGAEAFEYVLEEGESPFAVVDFIRGAGGGVGDFEACSGLFPVEERCGAAPPRFRVLDLSAAWEM